MFLLNDDLSIYVTRGDAVAFNVGARNAADDDYIFKAGDIVRIKVFEKKACDNVVLQKDFSVDDDCEAVAIFLTEADTKIGGVISKPVDYWYEVELNPHTEPQTIIGYDEDGAKVLRLFPEGADIPPYVPTPEDIPVVDEELDLASERPVQNAAISRAILAINKLIEGGTAATAEEFASVRRELNNVRELVLAGENSVQKMQTIADGRIAEALKGYASVGHNHDEAYAAKVHTHVNDFTFDIGVAEWSFDDTYGGYTATVERDGILGTDTPIVDVVLTNNKSTNDEHLAVWAEIARIVANDGSITVYAGDTAPETALSIKVKVVR